MTYLDVNTFFHIWSQTPTVRLGLCDVARAARPKSATFQRTIEKLRNGRSYQEFSNAIKAGTGTVFSRSYLKKVEAGDLAPNPLLVYSLEIFSGERPSELLREAVGANRTDDGFDGHISTAQGETLFQVKAQLEAVTRERDQLRATVEAVRGALQYAKTGNRGKRLPSAVDKLIEAFDADSLVSEEAQPEKRGRSSAHASDPKSQ